MEEGQFATECSERTDNMVAHQKTSGTRWKGRGDARVQLSKITVLNKAGRRRKARTTETYFKAALFSK
jgi:hypothetical protein